MIPALATIVTVYSVFRILEICLQGRERFSHTGTWIVAVVFGLIAIAVIVSAWGDIVSRGSTGLTVPR